MTVPSPTPTLDFNLFLMVQEHAPILLRQVMDELAEMELRRRELLRQKVRYERLLKATTEYADIDVNPSDIDPRNLQ